MVHLICLHCHRANAAEAKFCTECGAGLLRRFCKSCHAANDSAAHFCQACGTALRPASDPAPGSANPPAQVADFLPSLTDVVTLAPTTLQPAPDLPLTVGSRPGAELLHDNPPWAATPHPAPARAKAARVPGQAFVMLALGAAVVVPIAAWFWPTFETRTVGPVGKPASRLEPAAPATMRTATSTDRSADAAAAAADAAAKLLQTYPEPLPATEDKGGAGPSVAAKNQRDIREPAKVAQKRGNAEPVPVARAPARATGPAEGVPTARAPRPTATPPTAPPRECTPAMDALALCAPTTNTTGR